VGARVLPSWRRVVASAGSARITDAPARVIVMACGGVKRIMVGVGVMSIGRGLKGGLSLLSLLSRRLLCGGMIMSVVSPLRNELTGKITLSLLFVYADIFRLFFLANVPSDWNDRISDVGLRGEGSEVGCQLFL